MDIFNKDFENIIQLIENDDLKSLKSYLENNNIKIEKFNNSFFDILIYAIESRTSISIIDFIIEQCSYSNLNYTFYDNGVLKNKYNFSYKHHISDNGWKVPLFSAIAFNNFEISNLLIGKKANINYVIKEKKHSEKNILQYLEHIYYLNKKNLNYVLNNGFHVKGITFDLMNKLISVDNDGFLDIIFKHYIFNNSFILGFLYFNKSRTPLSKKQLKQIVFKEKSKIKIKKSMYQNAFILCFERMDIIELLMENDVRDPTAILNQINIYVLLENALFLQSLNMVKRILSNSFVKFDINKLENIFQHEIRNNRYENLKYALEILEKNCSFNINQLNFEKLLLHATHDNDNSLYIKYKEIKDVNHKIIIFLLQFILKAPIHCIERIDVSLLKNKGPSYLSLILNALIILQELPLIKFLLEKDELKVVLNINSPDKNNNFPIFIALSKTYSDENYLESLKIFEYLLIKGANCAVMKHDETLWSSVINARNYFTIKCLLKNCCLAQQRKDVLQGQGLLRRLEENENYNVDRTDDIILKIYDNLDEWRPLVCAICNDDLNLVQDIIKEMKIKRCNDKLFPNFLVISYLIDRKEIFKWLIENVNINECDQYGCTILFYAIVKGDLEVVHFLMNANVNVNVVYYNKKQPIRNHDKQWNDILDIGFKRYLSMIGNMYNNKKNVHNQTMYSAGDFSLHISIYCANKDVTYSLLHHNNINIDVYNEQEETPLISLIKNQYFTMDDKVEIIKVLIAKGANIQYINKKSKKSPLAYAIQYHSLPIIKLLIEHGANFNSNMMLLEQNQSLIRFTILQGDFEIYKYFVDSIHKDIFNDNNFICSLMETFNKHKNLEIFKHLIRNMIDINNFSCDILPVIISVSHLELLKLFVEYGLDLKGKSKDFGEKALQYAINNEVLSIAEYLIENGVNSSYLSENI